MKRLVFSILAILVLTAGAAMAQSTINTPAPGPTQQQEPGQTNNNLPNPGNPVPLAEPTQEPLQEEGTVEGTATESINNNQGSQTTGTMGTTGTTPLNNETETGTGPDVDVDTGANAEGAVDVDVTSTTDADTDASGIDETGGLDTDTDTETGSLPATASNQPLLALLGLLALGAAFAIRRF
ncbi:MAG TPA: LPXTG cell wall anchor domain-containing protein [Thermoanaerobaculia bacterium]